MKRLLYLIAILLPLSVAAETVEIDGIYYNLISKGKIAAVTKNPNKYSGKIVIPESIVYQDVEYVITSVENNAFTNCSDLTGLNISNNVTTIGEGAFWYCSSLSFIELPNSIISIGKKAFHSCSSLQSIVLPDSLKSIAESTFENCIALKSITIPNSVTNIGPHAFSSCKNIASIDLPNGVVIIGSNAFSGCDAIKSITIPNSVTYIGDYAFHGCRGIKSITIPNSVTYIGEGAFRYCTGLAYVSLPDDLGGISGYTFHNCSSLAHLTIPNNVYSIGDYAFAGCTSLTSLRTPKRLSSIGKNAFKGCSNIISVLLESGIKEIGECAFEECDQIADFICMAENVPRTNRDVFKNSYIEYSKLYVPESSIQSYKTTEPWSSFGKIVSLEGVEPEVKKCSTPTISYINGNLKYECATEGVQYISEISDRDIKKHFEAEIALSATYNISVYATKEGYENSDVATATLCWIDAEPMQEGTIEAEDGVTEVKAIPVLIQAEGNTITVQGAAEGTEISAYNTNGIKLSSTIANKGITTLNTKLPSGSTAIVKIGERAVKVLVK